MTTQDDNKSSSIAIPRLLVRFLDCLIFIGFFYFGSQYYQVDHKIFDLIGLGAIAYIALRKPDINTLTLIAILLAANGIPALVIYSHGQLGGYPLYSMLFLVNLIGAIAIWSRPFLILRFGPDWLKNRAQHIASNRQDQVMGLLFTFQALWQLMQFSEHVLRHLDDIGLEGLFGNWVPMMFYNMYKTGQFGFAILTMLILYFMTFDASKAERR